MAMRKGMGKGKGKGYKNIIRGHDSKVHAQSRRGIKQPQRIKIIRKIKTKPQIGDFKSPNKYWVSYSNDFLICKKGQCDWASDTQDFKVKSKTIKEFFNTYKEAQEYIDRNLAVSDVPKEDQINNITIEDRYSGQVWEQGVYAYPKKSEGILKSKGWHFEIETHDDIGFTKEEMKKRKEKFG